MIANDKRGISAPTLSKQLKINYKSARFLPHRLRCATGNIFSAGLPSWTTAILAVQNAVAKEVAESVNTSFLLRFSRMKTSGRNF
jgi:hypothetical protein